MLDILVYIEVDDYPTGENIMDILNYAYKNTNISYIGINFHIRYCKDCGTYLQVMKVNVQNVDSRDIQGISRVTGYLSLDERFGPGNMKKEKIEYLILEAIKIIINIIN